LTNTTELSDFKVKFAVFDRIADKIIQDLKIPVGKSPHSSSFSNLQLFSHPIDGLEEEQQST